MNEPADTTDDDADGPRERIEREAERAVDGFDAGVVDLLSWLLETETRSRIYVYLRQHPGSTSEEIASGTGLYPSTVREALAELAEDGTVTRRKRADEGAGNDPYEYEAIPPSDLVGGMVAQLQEQLNAVFTLDSRVDDDDPGTREDPITISIDEETTDESDDT